MDNKSNQLRKFIRLADYDYSWAGYYFITVVSYHRKNIFGDIKNDIVRLNKVGKITEKCWKEIPLHFPYCEIDSFVIMPNHFHGILIINDPVEARHASPLPPQTTKFQPLGIIVGSFKSAVTKRVHDSGLYLQENIWQRNYYEHVIRDENNYQKIYEYIESNPINWAHDEENITQY
jgi:REP element-mobilizing transposase RayT